METKTEAVLAERRGTHGNFAENAGCSQALKGFMAEYGGEILSAVQREALDNICQKIARILCGNPNHEDHWADIAGYATLVVKDIEDGTN